MLNQLQLQPKLIAVTTPQDFALKRVRVYCAYCREVKLHDMRMDGVRTYYRCPEGHEFTREGAIR